MFFMLNVNTDTPAQWYHVRAYLALQSHPFLEWLIT